MVTVRGAVITQALVEVLHPFASVTFTIMVVVVVGVMVIGFPVEPFDQL